MTLQNRGDMTAYSENFAREDIISKAAKSKTVDILRGLSAFAAEQVVAMSLSKDGIDEETLWQRKKRMIEQTPGLQVWKGGESTLQILPQAQ